MANVTVRIPKSMCTTVESDDVLTAQGTTVHEVLLDLSKDTSLAPRIFDGDGKVWGYISFFLGDESIHNRDGFDTRVGDGDVIRIIPAIAGG